MRKLSDCLFDGLVIVPHPDTNQAGFVPWAPSIPRTPFAWRIRLPRRKWRDPASAEEKVNYVSTPT